MNILIINLGKKYGGAEKVIENLIFSNLENCNFHIALLEGTKFEEKINEKNFSKKLTLKGKKTNLISIIYSLIKYVNENKIDLIHAHGVTGEIIGFIVSKFTKIKMITTIHSRADYDMNNSLKGKIYVEIQKKLYRFNERYILVSDELEKFFINQGINKKNLIVIENGIKPLRDGEFKKDLSNELKICSIGRLTTVKRHDNLINGLVAIKKVGIPFKCYIAGDGELEIQLKDMVKKEGLEKDICFLGFITDVKKVMDESNLMILNSDMEGLPITVLEAMSYKIPIMANSVGGIKFLLNDRNSIILENNKSDEIKKRLIAFYEKKYDLESIVENAYSEYKKKYDLESFLKRHQQLYIIVKGD